MQLSKPTPLSVVTATLGLLVTWPWPRPLTLQTVSKPLPRQIIKVRLLPLPSCNPCTMLVSFQPWTAKDPSHCMPIITPCTPELNSTHNVRPINKTQIIAEAKKGLLALEKVLDGGSWEEFFSPFPFFQQCVLPCSARLLACG